MTEIPYDLLKTYTAGSTVVPTWQLGTPNTHHLVESSQIGLANCANIESSHLEHTLTIVRPSRTQFFSLCIHRIIVVRKTRGSDMHLSKRTYLRSRRLLLYDVGSS